MSEEIKIYVTPDQLRSQSFRLAASIVASEFNPTHVLVLLRGAASIGNYVHEMLNRAYKRKLAYESCVTSRIPRGNDYDVDVRADPGMTQRIGASARVVIINDIFDSGRTIEAVIKYLGRIGIDESQLRVAVIDYKPEKNLTQRIPEHYINVHEANTWIVYPHEINGVDDKDLDTVFGTGVSNIVQLCQDLIVTFNMK